MTLRLRRGSPRRPAIARSAVRGRYGRGTSIIDLPLVVDRVQVGVLALASLRPNR